MTSNLKEFTRENEEKKKQEAEKAAKLKEKNWDDFHYGADFKGRGESLWQTSGTDEENAVGLTEIQMD